MITFCRDIDILKYEPSLFFDNCLEDQVLAAGSAGDLTGTAFTVTGADFINAGIESGNVLTLVSSADGSKIGSYEVVSVDSAEQLTVSVLRADDARDPIAPGDVTGADYKIVTYTQQIAQVSYDLTEYFGIQPGQPASEITADNVTNDQALKQSAVLAVISWVYVTLASSIDDTHLWEKSYYYRKLFKKCRESCQLHIDVGLDGNIDFTMVGSSVRLVRD